jgi:Lrp/AsnC family transcriptional regulator for asnA, asnC and gidA
LEIQAKLDELDRKILEKLKDDCVKPFVKVAHELGVTEGTIRQRVKKLVNRGVIRKFTVDLDAPSIGLPVVSFLLLSVSVGDIPKTVEEISKIRSVVEIHQIHTLGDLLVKVRTSGLNELGEIIANKIRAIKSITAVNSVIPSLKVWKDTSA